ncbi:MAG: TraX family protein [Rickettsiales bacterium]
MLRSIKQYGGFNSYDLLKVIAILAMFIDHLGFFFYPDIEIFRVIGRMSYALFAFAIGYSKKYNFDITILVLAILMLLNNYISNSTNFHIAASFKTSILFAIIITRLSMKYLHPKLNSNNIVAITFILWGMSFGTSYIFQYGTLGIIMAICGYWARTQNNNLLYQIFLGINLILYALFEIMVFNFSSLGCSLLLVEFLILFKLFSYFNIHTISLNKLYQNTLLTISRYSLLLYFVHYELFYVLQLYLERQIIIL